MPPCRNDVAATAQIQATARTITSPSPRSMNVRDRVAGGASSIAARRPAAANPIRRGLRKPRDPATSRSAAATMAAENSPATSQRAAAMRTKAIQRQTGVSKSSTVTNACGNFFSKGVSATTW